MKRDYIEIHQIIMVERDVKKTLLFDAILKWYVLKPEIFIINPNQFKNKILYLQHQVCNSYQQRDET